MLILPLLAWLLLLWLAALAALIVFNWALSGLIERLAPPLGRFIEVDGLRLHVLDSGEKPGQSAPPLLFLHGLLGQLQNFTYALTALFPDRRIVLLDRPGSGYSQAAPSQTLAAQAAVAAAVIDALKLDRPLIVGHSLGGAVALALALDHPERVGGLALIAPLTQALVLTSRPFAGLAFAARLARWLGAWTLGPAVTILRSAKAGEQAFAPEPPKRDFWNRGGGLLAARPSALLAAARDIESQPQELPLLAARYASLTVPVGVLFGAQDRVLDPATQGADFCARAPRAEMTLIDGGHMLPVTQPQATKSFIRQVLVRLESR
jgi:pimeloyl-ACP methyl ester carboxylesterase